MEEVDCKVLKRFIEFLYLHRFPSLFGKKNTTIYIRTLYTLR